MRAVWAARLSFHLGGTDMKLPVAISSAFCTAKKEEFWCDLKDKLLLYLHYKGVVGRWLDPEVSCAPPRLILAGWPAQDKGSLGLGWIPDSG